MHKFVFVIAFIASHGTHGTHEDCTLVELDNTIFLE